MPSPIGHLLAGVATSLTADIVHPPKRGSIPPKRLALTCALLAAAPDLDLVWPPIHRTATHSVTAIVIVFIVAASVTGQVNRWRTAIVCACAYGSHLVLDWLAVDRRVPFGLQLLWPFSDRWFISGWNVFPETARSLPLQRLVLTNVKAVAVEAALLLPIVALLWLIRVKTAPRFSSEVSRSHHAAE